MIHLDSVLFYSLAAFICFTAAAIFQSFNETKEEKEFKQKFYCQPIITGDKNYNLNSDSTINTKWNETAKELIEIAKEIQKPRTIAVINDKVQTQSSRRVSKRSNTKPKKRTKASKSNHKKSGKAIRIRSK